MNNTLHLMHSLGWKGGTIHQVVKVVGLDVIDVLDLHKKVVVNVIAYEHGKIAASRDMVKFSGYTSTDRRYYAERLSFWRGVLDAYRDKHICY